MWPVLILNLQNWCFWIRQLNPHDRCLWYQISSHANQSISILSTIFFHKEFFCECCLNIGDYSVVWGLRWSSWCRLWAIQALWVEEPQRSVFASSSLRSGQGTNSARTYIEGEIHNELFTLPKVGRLTDEGPHEAVNHDISQEGERCLQNLCGTVFLIHCKGSPFLKCVGFIWAMGIAQIALDPPPLSVKQANMEKKCSY